MSVPAPGDDRLEGVVAAYDDHVGLGEVTTPAGHRYGFHCTQIAGGGRTVPVGQEVSFVVIPGRGGRWEAGDLRAAAATGVDGQEPSPEAEHSSPAPPAPPV